MSNIELTIACGRYDRTQALIDGRVQPEGVDLTYIPLRPGPFGTGFEALLFDGVLALAGLVMVVPLFVPSRWRRRPGSSSYDATYRELEATQAMDAVGLLDNWTATAPQPRMGLDQDPLPWVPAEPGPAAPPGCP